MSIVTPPPARLRGYERLDTITDREGFTWVISYDGNKAALLWGPPSKNGFYDWAAARAARRDVSLDIPSSKYTDARDGPCHLEIHVFLASRRAERLRAKVVAAPPSTPPKSARRSAGTWARGLLSVVAKKLGMTIAPLRRSHKPHATSSIHCVNCAKQISVTIPNSILGQPIERKRSRLARSMPMASQRAAALRRNGRRPR
jgi:hypothetical protein